MRLFRLATLWTFRADASRFWPCVAGQPLLILIVSWTVFGDHHLNLANRPSAFDILDADLQQGASSKGQRLRLASSRLQPANLNIFNHRGLAYCRKNRCFPLSTRVPQPPAQFARPARTMKSFETAAATTDVLAVSQRQNRVATICGRGTLVDPH